jgi:signal peptidase I
MKNFKDTKSNKQVLIRIGFRLGISILISLFIVFILRTFFIFTYIIPNDSMLPNFPKDKKIILYKSSQFFLGDVVLIQQSKNSAFLARIVAKEGDRIFLKDKNLNRNGNFVSEKFVEFSDKRVLSSRISKRDSMEEMVVTEKSYFVLVDNRDLGIDSRELGFINKKDILGKVLF